MIRRLSPVLAVALLLTGDMGGMDVVELTYHPCGDTPVFCFGKPRECDGLINELGEILYRFKASHGINGPFNEGLIAAESPDSGRWGYLGTRGQWAIQPQFRRASTFHQGLARVQEDGSWLVGFINKKGEYVIPPRFEDASDFDEYGLARFWVGRLGSKERRVGVIDQSGQVVLEPTWLAMEEFSGGVARAMVGDSPCWSDDAPWMDILRVYGGSRELYSKLIEERPERRSVPRCRWTLIDTRGNPVTQRRFRDIGAFSDGLAPARVDHLWGYIDRTGEFQLPPIWTSASRFSDGLAAVLSQSPAASFEAGPIKKDWRGFINAAGEAVFETNVAGGEFHDGIAFVDGRAIDRDGNALFQAPGKGWETPYCHGLSQVILDNRSGQDAPMETGFIDRKGRVVFSWKWRWDD